jgi:hypothetical protein
VTTLVNVPAAASPAIERAPRARQRGLAKRVVWLGATLLAIEIFYLVAGNLFLGFALLPIVNRHPERLLIGYARAYTLWPGVAHVERFVLRDESRTFQWRVELDQADVTIDLLDLFGKKFSATRVRATGVAFRLRHRLDDAGAATARARALPPIDGFDDPPLAPVGPAPPPVSDADYDSWRVYLADVDALAHEVWMEEHRLTGAIRVRGGVYVIPDRRVHVASTTVDIDDGELQIGDHVAMSKLDARITSRFGAIDLNGSREETLRAISARARLDARTPGLEFVRLYLGDPPALRVAGGAGALHVDYVLENGRAMPPTAVTATCDSVTLGAAKFTATFDYRLDLRVENASPEPTATGDLLIRKATIDRAGAEGASPTLHDARAHFKGLPRDLAGPLTIEKTELDVPATIPELRWLLPAHDRAVSLGGSGAIRARVDVNEAMKASGTIEASARGVELGAPTFQLGGRLATTARFHDGDVIQKSVILDPSTVVAEEITVTRDSHAHPGGTLHVDVTEGRVDDGVPRDFALALAATSPDLGWLFWRNPGKSRIVLTARAANLDARLRIAHPASLFDGTPEEAAIVGSLGIIGAGDVRFAGTTLRGDVEATGQLQRLDLGRGLIELRALHAITRDLTVYGGHVPKGGWWGKFDVSQLDVETKDPMSLELRGDARCKDGSPFNAILASEDVIPGWVGAIFPMTGLTASAELRRAHGALDLGLSAHGSSANVTVQMHDIGKALTGAVKVDTNLVSLGVGFSGGESHVKLFAGEEWLNTRIAEVKAAEEQAAAAE